jgi:hypothetical protein
MSWWALDPMTPILYDDDANSSRLLMGLWTIVTDMKAMRFAVYVAAST